jgi:nanoRNase/pAp phosphatase (c-di-AMP/oligoRNAs hydrolase)
MAAIDPKSRVAGLLQALEGPTPLVILPHDNPDPDALASAATLKYIVRGLLGKDAVIGRGGIVGRAENRAMLKYLNIELTPVGELDLRGDVLVALVDTQPGRSNNSCPEERMPTVVIDHHPAYACYDGVRFLDMREHYGATSTILTEYLQESRLDVEAKIATALFYGISAETQDLGRESTPADIAAAQFLYPYANKRRLAKIENARVPRVYFRAFHDAIEHACINERAIVSILPEVQYPDMVAEVADFLLRLDQVDWAAAIATFNGCLHCSVRTTDRDANAGELLRRVLGSKSAGGHEMIAGGRIPVGPDQRVRDEAVTHVRERLLTELSIEDAGRPLV